MHRNPLMEIYTSQQLAVDSLHSPSSTTDTLGQDIPTSQVLFPPMRGKHTSNTSAVAHWVHSTVSVVIHSVTQFYSKCSPAPPTPPPNSLVPEINPSTLYQPWKAFVNASRFDLAGLLLQLSSFSCTCPFWLALFASLCVALLCPSSSLCWVFSVTGSLPVSFQAIQLSWHHLLIDQFEPVFHSCLLAWSGVWEVPAGLWGSKAGCCEQKALMAFHYPVLRVTGASHSNGNLTKCSNFPWNTMLERKQRYRLSYEFHQIYQNSPLRWIRFYIYCKIKICKS